MSSLGYTAGRFALELNGSHAGFLLAAKFAKNWESLAPVSGSRAPAGGLLPEACTAISLTFGAAMSRTFYDWVGACLRGQVVRNVAVLACDFDGNIRSRYEIVTGTMSEASLPALKAGSQAAASITVRVAGRFRRVELSASPVQAGPHWPKPWYAGYFHFVTKSAGIPVNAIGGIGETSVRPGRGVQLDVTVLPPYLAAFQAWQNRELGSARVEYLRANLEPFAALACRRLRRGCPGAC